MRNGRRSISHLFVGPALVSHGRRRNERHEHLSSKTQLVDARVRSGRKRNEIRNFVFCHLCLGTLSPCSRRMTLWKSRRNTGGRVSERKRNENYFHFIGLKCAHMETRELLSLWQQHIKRVPAYHTLHVYYYTQRFRCERHGVRNVYVSSFRFRSMAFICPKNKLSFPP